MELRLSGKKLAVGRSLGRQTEERASVKALRCKNSCVLENRKVVVELELTREVREEQGPGHVGPWD